MTYSTQEAARLTGLSLRQLQLMDDQQVVCPQRKPGSSTPWIHPRNRFYSPRDIQRLHLVARLLGLGLRTREIREVVLKSDIDIYRGAKWVAIYRGTAIPKDFPLIPMFFSDAKALIRYGVTVGGGMLTVELP